MPAIQFGGISSGLDTESIIKSLMNVERLPLTRLRTQATTLTERRTAYGTLGTALTNMLAKVQAFTLTNAGSARTATSTDATRFTAVATSSAVPGQYRVKVDRLASATRATSTVPLGTAVTDVTAAGTMGSLPLPGSVTAGTVGLAVDGRIVSVTVGDPAVTSLRSVIDGIAAAVQAQAQATDPGATVSASIVDNQLRLTIAGAAANHDVLLGVSGDTSNALSLFGVAGQRIAGFGLTTTTITGSARLGVTQAAAKLDAAGLTGLASTAAGLLTINGVGIAYDSTVDSLNTVLTRINNSQAGVVASVDRINDRIALVQRTAGSAAISIVDTSGSLAAALNLAPGTIDAQVIGQGAQVTVDERIVTGVTNTIANAIDGVTLNLLDLSTTSATLTVGVDNSAIKQALTDLVTSYNALADSLDTLTSSVPGGTSGVLHDDSNLSGLGLGVRSLIMARVAGPAAPLASLGDLGVNSGAVGAKAGTTTRLSLDAERLAAALDDNPTRVAYLLSQAGGIMEPLQARIKALTGTNGLIASGQAGVDAELRANSTRQAQMQDRIDLKQLALERKFAALEATMARLQGQASQVTAQVDAFSSDS